MAYDITTCSLERLGMDWDWGIIAASFVAASLVAYLLRQAWKAMVEERSDSKRPPTAPWSFPLIGHTIQFVFWPTDLLAANRERFGRKSLWKLCLPGQVSFQVSSLEHVAKLFRGQGMILTESHSRIHERSFGMPREGAQLWENDDSGYGPHPLPGSTVSPDERIVYDQHNFTMRNLSGESLETLGKHYQERLVEGLTALADSMDDDWVEHDDLKDLLHTHITRAAILAIYGPHMLRLNPNLVEDLWGFIPWTIHMYLGIPRWLLPRAYRIRDKILEGIQRYYQHAEEKYDPVDGADEEWEECWGSRFNRRKHRDFWVQYDKVDVRTRAAEDLSFLWASNANSVEAAIWTVTEILRDPVLLDRVRAEFAQAKQQQQSPSPASSTSSSSTTLFDITKLCSMPVCQAVYAEVLRLRVILLILRKAKHDLDFGGWLIRKGERVGVSTSTRAREPEFWNTGSEGQDGEELHPVHEFWADRFLVYPDDPTSGPLKSPPPSAAAARSTTVTRGEKEKEEVERGQEEVQASDRQPTFSMTGTTNSWIPYSGGPRLCPGRHFAKQEIIVTAAATLSTFDIELRTPKGWTPQMDTKQLGGGTMPIKGKIPCRIRKRRV